MNAGPVARTPAEINVCDVGKSWQHGKCWPVNWEVCRVQELGQLLRNWSFTMQSHLGFWSSCLLRREDGPARHAQGGELCLLMTFLFITVIKRPGKESSAGFSPWTSCFSGESNQLYWFLSAHLSLGNHLFYKTRLPDLYSRRKREKKQVLNENEQNF